MAKNMTRKGLALGAGLALVSSALVAAPAQAAGELTLTPVGGSELVIPSDLAFGMRVNYGTGFSPSNAANLKVRFTTNGGFQLNADQDSTIANASDSLASTVAANSTSASLTLGANLDYVYFGVNSASASTTYTVTVQAYEDADADGVVDATEWQSDVKTVTFLKHSDITWNVSIVEPVVTSAAATSTVRVTSNVNLGQMTWGTGGASAGTMGVIRFEEDTTTAGTYAAIGSAPTGLAYDTVNNRLSATSGNSAAAFAAGDKVRASFYFDSTAREAATATSGWTAKIAGTGSYGTPAGATTYGVAVKSVEATVLTPTISALGAIYLTDSATAKTNKVLAGTNSFVVSTDATVVAGQAKAGIPVTFTIEENSANDLAAAAVITAGGKELKNSNVGTVQSISVVVLTDADGTASLTIATTGTVSGDQFDVDADAQGFDATDLDLEALSRTVGSVANITNIGGSQEVVVATSTAVALRIGVVDQFGYAISDLGYSVNVTDSTSTVEAPVSAGVATISFPAYSTAGTRTLTVQGKKNGVNAGSSISVTVKVGTDGTVANFLYSGVATGGGTAFGAGTDTDLALNTVAFTAGDTRIGFQPAAIDAKYTTITVNLYDSANAAVAGSVTLSGTGLDFLVDGVYARDTITVRSTAAGVVTARIYSNKAGAKTLTITSGSVTKTQSVVHAAAAANTATSLTLNAPATALPGSTINIEGTLADKFGNPVTPAAGNSFKVSYLGVGFMGALSGPTDGAFSFQVLISGSEAGTATVTARYDRNEDGDYADATDLVVAKTITIGAPEPVAKIGSFNGRVAVRVENAKGSTISVKIGRSWYKYNALNNNYLQSWKSRKGRSVAVSVYVDGELQNVQTITVK